MNRTDREALRKSAPAIAARLAAATINLVGSKLVPVSDPLAVGALARAFTLLIRAGGKPVAVPLSRGEVLAFPKSRPLDLPGTVHWLAVGTDGQGLAISTVHSVCGPVKAVAHDLARSRALAAISEFGAFSGLDRPR